MESPRGQITVAEAAKRLGVTVSLVRRWCRSGKISAWKVGRDWTIACDKHGVVVREERAGNA
jgi:excisionase family DNA binding protein